MGIHGYMGTYREIEGLQYRLQGDVYPIHGDSNLKSHGT